MTAIGLRPYLATDGAACAKLFQDSVDLLTDEDYDSEQRAAWAEVAEDPAFLRKLGEGLTLLATLGGALAGFASLKGETIEHLYVSPEHARQKVGTALLDALIRLAGARGATKLVAEVSETAKPLFTKFGFVGQKRNVVSLGDAWLANTTMALALQPQTGAKPTQH